MGGLEPPQPPRFLRQCLTVLTNISSDNHNDYNVLVTALDQRFGIAHRAELNRVKLRGRVRKREETLPELAEEVEHLARLAYPNAAAEMVEVLAKDQFIDALPMKTSGSGSGKASQSLCSKLWSKHWNWNLSTLRTSSAANLCERFNLSLTQQHR